VDERSPPPPDGKVGTPWERVLPQSSNQALRAVASVNELLLILGKPSCLLETSEDEEMPKPMGRMEPLEVSAIYWLIVVLCCLSCC